MATPNAFTRTFSRLREYSAFLLIGTALALIWANIGLESYEAFVDTPLLDFKPFGHTFSFHYIVNDIFMVLFFGMAAKEVSESVLPGGALSSVKKAALPVVATAGGVLGPIFVFYILHLVLDTTPETADVFAAAWAVPTATDIAYCWLFAVIIFGKSHPAVNFLLVLAVLDDLIGMMIIAIYYSTNIQWSGLGLVVLAVVICEVFRRKGIRSFWPYVIVGGTLSWIGLSYTGVHAALALVPIIPFMPHAKRDEGLFVASDYPHSDTQHAYEGFFSPIVDVGLLTFGLANAGVVLSGDSFTGSATWMILLALLVGKTLGISAFAQLGKTMGLSLPAPIRMSHVVVMGMVAGIGFTVALFVTGIVVNIAGQPDSIWHLPPHIGDMLKLGALLSFAAGPIAVVMGIMFKIKKLQTPEEVAVAVAAMEAQS